MSVSSNCRGRRKADDVISVKMSNYWTYTKGKVDSNEMDVEVRMPHVDDKQSLIRC